MRRDHQQILLYFAFILCSSQNSELVIVVPILPTLLRPHLTAALAGCAFLPRAQRGQLVESEGRSSSPRA